MWSQVVAAKPSQGGSVSRGGSRAREYRVILAMVGRSLLGEQ